MAVFVLALMHAGEVAEVGSGLVRADSAFGDPGHRWGVVGEVSDGVEPDVISGRY